jgi:hypothetical protein
MRKVATSMTLTESTIEFISHIAEMNDISKSQTMELFSEMVKDYFSNDQIKLELQTRDSFDGRIGKKSRDN